MAQSGPASRTSPAVAELLELVGRRWTLRILWELDGRTLSFNQLRRAVGGMSQSVLVTRLTELFGAGLIADVEGGYRLTAHGAALADGLSGLEAIAAAWRERAPAAEPGRAPAAEPGRAPAEAPLAGAAAPAFEWPSAEPHHRG